MLDEQADQIYAMGDPIAERVRKVGGTTLRSIGHIARLQRIKDNDADYVDALDMLAELREDNKALTSAPARSAQCLRRPSRHRHGQPDQGMDRRNRAAHVVPVQGEPPRRRDGTLTTRLSKPTLPSAEEAVGQPAANSTLPPAADHSHRWIGADARRF